AAGSKDAAIVRSLAAGAYSFQITGAGTGLTRAELYDADSLAPFAANRLVRVSLRAKVGTGSGTVLGQFVISGTAPKRVLLRGAGPALLKVDSKLAVLANPFLRLRRISGSVSTVIRENDDWAVGHDTTVLARASAQAGATPGFASGSKDAAILITLPPGSYSVELLGRYAGTGIGQLEIYEVK
ncbi:MAG TPA: hypothetical protein VHE13_02220, partial [Opitutus sp.]|nr:hypothetical protein [Opitutus sp.]